MVDILLIEDNNELADLIQAFLNKEGFSLFHAQNGEQALAWMKTDNPKLLLLDIMLPNMDGFAVCEAVRSKSSTPIIMISARSAKNDKLMGFELGADDYMEKPVDIDILCAKVRALLKRFDQQEKSTSVITSGTLRIDCDARKVYLHDELLEFNVKEYELLLLFVRNAGKTLHKEFLFNQIWGMESESENQTLTVHIKMLRIKVEEDPKLPKRIQTVWGVGYRYEEV